MQFKISYQEKYIKTRGSDTPRFIKEHSLLRSRAVLDLRLAGLDVCLLTHMSKTF